MNYYTSMPLSFLALFEIHSVDWFGLVFVLPLLLCSIWKQQVPKATSINKSSGIVGITT